MEGYRSHAAGEWVERLKCAFTPFFSSERPKFSDAIVNNNESQQTTNNRGYDSQPEEAPGMTRAPGRNPSVSISRMQRFGGSGQP
jgi:hypothetical protein